MAQAIIVMGKDSDHVEIGFKFRRFLIEEQKFSKADIDLIYGARGNPRSATVKIQLQAALDERDNGEPLLLVYTGHGGPEGWALQTIQEEELSYVDLTEMLAKFKSPLLFINGCCHSNDVIKSCGSLLTEDRHLGIITVLRDVGTSHYFFARELEAHWKCKTPYDPELWNVHTGDMIFGRVKVYLEECPDGFNRIRVRPEEGESLERSTVRSLGDRNRHGQILDHLFWPPSEPESVAAAATP